VLIAFFDLLDEDDFKLFRENDSPPADAQSIIVTVFQFFNTRTVREGFQFANSIFDFDTL
jgi:hypothetical protein